MGSGESRELRWVTWMSDRRSPSPRNQDGTAEAAELLFPPVPRVDSDAVAASYHAWNRSLAAIRTDNELFNLALDRSAGDLRLLLNDGPTPAIATSPPGVPWFTTLFGRDAIIASFQALAVRPQLAIETLEVLASLQADHDDPDRDAEPGKIPHELRTGEMARSGELPHRPYYGTVDATPLWLILLGATWDWTGDRALLDRLWPHALRALDWIDNYGDLDGDGFLEYRRRTPNGLLNQGWKDSHDAIRDRHGRLAEGPIALAEVQGYVFDAKRRMARAGPRPRGRGAGRPPRARRRAAAVAVRGRVLVGRPGLLRLALDGEKRRADAHRVERGALPVERHRVAGPGPARGGPPDEPRHVLRLGDPDLRVGADRLQPHRLPHGHRVAARRALIAAGFKRYGHHDEANLLIERIFQASQHFADFRLPELFCGFDRDNSPVPVPYPVACSPQAWAAGSVFLFAETMLGLRPHAHRRELELRRPELPDWLAKVTVTNLRVGEDTVDLLVHRWRGGTSAEVIRKAPDLDVTIRM